MIFDDLIASIIQLLKDAGPWLSIAGLAVSFYILQTRQKQYEDAAELKRQERESAEHTRQTEREEALRSQINDLHRATIEALRQDIGKQSEALKKEALDLKAARDEIDHLRAKIGDQDKRIDQMLKELSKAKAINEQLLEENAQTMAEKTKVEAEAKALKTYNDALVSTLEKTVKQLNDTKQVVETMKREITALENRVRELEDSNRVLASNVRQFPAPGQDIIDAKRHQPQPDPLDKFRLMPQPKPAPDESAPTEDTLKDA